MVFLQILWNGLHNPFRVYRFPEQKKETQTQEDLTVIPGVPSLVLRLITIGFVPTGGQLHHRQQNSDNTKPETPLLV